MASLSEVLARKKPVTQTLNVKLDPEGDETVDFTLRALGRKAWRDLMDAHQATPEQQAEYLARQEQIGIPERKREFLQYNADTFPPAAIALSLIEPTATLEEAQAMWDGDEFAEGEQGRILAVIFALNGQADATVNWGKGSGQTDGSENDSPSAEPTGSPSPSS